MWWCDDGGLAREERNEYFPRAGNQLVQKYTNTPIFVINLLFELKSLYNNAH
jgi:hypothetical protein